jgi:hypothetical protein
MEYAGGTITCTIGSTSASATLNGWSTPAEVAIEAYPYDAMEMPATIRFDNVVVDIK